MLAAQGGCGTSTGSAGPRDVGLHLHRWLGWACRSCIPAFVTLSLTIRTNGDRILAAVELGPFELQA